MALTVLTDNSAASNTRTLTWTIPTLATGDVAVVSAMTWDQANTLNVPSGTGLSFTQRVDVSTAGKSRTYIWTAVASGGGSSVVVTSSVLAGGASMHNGSLYLCPTADGYSLAGSPNVLSAVGGISAPSGTLAGAAGSLGIIASGDWNGTTGASRAYLLSATDDLYAFSSGDNTQYCYHCTLTGASNTVGMSAPTTMSWTIAAVEVLVGGAPTAARVTAKVYNRAAINRASYY